jgi:hypothetical protein
MGARLSTKEPLDHLASAVADGDSLGDRADHLAEAGVDLGEIVPEDGQSLPTASRP